MSRNRVRGSWKNVILYTLLILFITTLLTNTSCSRKSEMNKWHYSQFIDRVEMGQVERITIRADRSQAVVITNDGQQALVDLPTDPEMLNILQRNGVGISVSPQSDTLYSIEILIGVGIALASFVFWLWILIDCAMKESNQGNTKLVWILIILMINMLGALIYFFVRRPQRLRELGQ